MGDLFMKFSKAVDAFADVLTEDVSSKKTVALYRYSDFTTFVNKVKENFPAVRGCTVSMTKKTSFEGTVFPEPKFLIRILLLQEDGRPASIEGDESGYLGTVVIASAVDTKMSEFMKGKTERTVRVWG